MNVTVITPTWDLDRAIEQIDGRRRVADTSARTSDVVVWTGAAVDVPPEQIKEIDVKIEVGDRYKRPRLLVMAASAHRPPVEAMMVGGLAAATKFPDTLMAFIHDDVTIMQSGWDDAVSRFFDIRRQVGLVGFGGALGLGTDDIYKTHYQLQQLVRATYLSNADDWQNHGGQLTKASQVSVLDGLSLIFRPEAYVQMSRPNPLNAGWFDCMHRDGIPFHMYDAWACCRMKEMGWEVWALPVLFHHTGGGTSVKFNQTYEDMVKRMGFKGGQDLYDRAHRTIYERFRTVLPLRVRAGGGQRT